VRVVTSIPARKTLAPAGTRPAGAFFLSGVPNSAHRASLRRSSQAGVGLPAQEALRRRSFAGTDRSAGTASDFCDAGQIGIPLGQTQAPRGGPPAADLPLRCRRFPFHPSRKVRGPARVGALLRQRNNLGNRWRTNIGATPQQRRRFALRSGVPHLAHSAPSGGGCSGVCTSGSWRCGAFRRPDGAV